MEDREDTDSSEHDCSSARRQVTPTPRRRKTRKFQRQGIANDSDSDSDFEMECTREARRVRLDAQAADLDNAGHDGDVQDPSQEVRRLLSEGRPFQTANRQLHYGDGSVQAGAPFSPGPEFQPEFDGEYDDQSEAQAVREAAFFRGRDKFYDELQAHLDSACRPCWKCKEAWINKGPHRRGIDGNWCCAQCSRPLDAGISTHFSWCNPTRCQDVVPKLPVLNRAELQIVSPICASITFVS